MPGARYAGRLRQGRIQARTLVVHGSADTVVDPRNAKLLASCITGARLVTFSGLGHLLFWEDPDGFAAVVKSFLLDADDAGRGPGGLHAIPASSRARHDRGGVLRRRPEPDAGMIGARRPQLWWWSGLLPQGLAVRGTIGRRSRPVRSGFGGTPPVTQKSQRSNKPELALRPPRRTFRRVSGFSSHGGARCSAGPHKSSRSWSVRSSPAAESRIVAGLLAPASGTMFGDCWRSQAITPASRAACTVATESSAVRSGRRTVPCRVRCLRFRFRRSASAASWVPLVNATGLVHAVSP